MKIISIIKTSHAIACKVIKQNILIELPTINYSRSYSNKSLEVNNIPIGKVVSASRTMTIQDIEKFTELSGDTNIIHNHERQENAVVHGAFLNSLVSAVIGTKLPGSGCLVVHQTLNFPNKCYVGETVDVTVEVVENRKIMKVDFICDVKEKKKTVLYGSAKLIMQKC